LWRGRWSRGCLLGGGFSWLVAEHGVGGLGYLRRRGRGRRFGRMVAGRSFSGGVGWVGLIGCPVLFAWEEKMFGGIEEQG